MKQNTILLTLLGALLLCASCSDDTETAQTSKGTIVFNLSQQTGTQTRATFSDGTEATVLSYAVYDADGTHISALDGTTTITDGTAQVDIALSKGDTYTVVFWAESEDSPYDVDFSEGTVSYKDDVTLTANDDSYDAFYATYTAIVTGDATVDVTLTRPFAQMNFGSDDVATYLLNDKTLTSTQVTVSGAYNTLDLLSGEASFDGSSTGGELTYAYADYPKNQAFPYSTTTDDDGTTTTSSYAWIGMVYLFAGNSSATVDATLAWSATTEDEDGHNISANSLPIQRNYRTNIYGSLLTSDQTYNVTLSADFGSSNDVSYIAATVTTEEQIETLLSSGYENVYVTLGDDLEISSSTILTVSDGTEVTIDLNGNDITATSTGARNIKIAAGGTLTITDSGSEGTVTNEGSSGSYGLFDVYGTLVVEGGTYVDDGAGDGALIRGRYGSTIIIEGGDFTVQDAELSSGSIVGNYVVNAEYSYVSITGGTYMVGENCWGGIKLTCCVGIDGGEVEISGVTITTTNTVGIELQATDATISDATITVETLNSYYSTAVAINNQSIVNITSGTYSGPYAVYIYNTGGYAYLKGGTYKGTTAVLKADNDTYANNCSDGRSEGSYIYVSDGYYTGSYSIATGGTYTTLLSISGGYFSEKPDDYVAEGYSSSEVSDTDGYSYKVSASSESSEE